MLRLKGAFSNNPRSAPLVQGAVQIKGVDIQWATKFRNPGELFAAQLRDNAFDVFEFSISDYVIVHSRPSTHWQWTAIPIFLSRALLQMNTWVHVRSGITGVADMKGKRLAVADYTQTAFVWFRAMIDRLYNIQSRDIAWYNGRAGNQSHAVLLGLKDNPPPGVSITYLSREDEANEMLQRGELHAVNAQNIPVDTKSPNVRPLFPDGGRAFMEEFYRAVGFTPVNHLVGIQRHVVEENPWLPEALFDAFERSKEEAYRRDPATRLIFRGETGMEAGASVFGSDPYLSGLSKNRAMLSMTVVQLLKDGLIRDRLDVDELFWETVRGS
jgi:4,5-dihydroxyphthalate decarboxylase